jgi:hypothetical protein
MLFRLDRIIVLFLIYNNPPRGDGPHIFSDKFFSVERRAP